MSPTGRSGGEVQVAPSPYTLMKKCYRKMRHATEVEAEAHLKELLSKPRGYEKNRLVKYQCDQCGGWHVGHKRKGK